MIIEIEGQRPRKHEQIVRLGLRYLGNTAYLVVLNDNKAPRAQGYIAKIDENGITTCPSLNPKLPFKRAPGGEGRINVIQSGSSLLDRGGGCRRRRSPGVRPAALDDDDYEEEG